MVDDKVNAEENIVASERDGREAAIGGEEGEDEELEVSKCK